MQKSIQLSLLSVALLSQLNASQIVNLEEITVTSATKTKQSIQDVTSNINVITSQDIEEKRFTTVTEALNSVPGVNFTTNGSLGANTSVFLRGFDSKRVLVLIDGIRYNDITGTSGAPFAHLMIGNIEQIEVVKGSQSGVWGADATAGVINIITKSAKNGLHASANVEYGSFNTRKYGALASHKTDDYYVKISSQQISTDGFSSKAPRNSDLNSFEKDGYLNTTSNIKLGFNVNSTNNVALSHTIIDANGNYDGYNSDPIKAANSTDTTKTQDSFTNINFNHVDSFNELDVYAKRSVFDREYVTTSKSEFDGEVYEYGLKSKIPYEKKDFTIIGLDYKTFEHKNDLNKKYSNSAFFITNNNEFAFGGKTIATQSLRVDAYDKFDDKTTGKFGVKNINNIIDGLTLSANVGTAYNVPTLYNLYSFYGNAGLNPESTLSYDASIKYKDFKITYFHSVVSEMIDYDFTISKYNNIPDESTIKGFELEYSSNIGEDILIQANYTNTDARNSDKEYLARRAKDTYKASIDYYAMKDLQIGLNGEYVGERFDKDDEKGAKTGDYSVVNAVINYDVNKNFSAYLKVDNLTDEYYQIVDGYATAERSAYVGIKATY